MPKSSQVKLPPPDYVTVVPGGSNPDSVGTPNPLGITVTWEAVPHASGYTVQWDTDPDFRTSTGSATTSAGKSLIYYIDKLDEGEYYVRVKANGSSSYTGSGYGAAAGPAAPARRMFAPKNLAFELNDSGNVITASWEAAEGAANGYSLERDQVASFDSESFVLEEFPQPTQLTHTIFDLSYRTEYYFRLRTRAVPGFVQSVLLVASQRTTLTAPTNLAMLTALSGQAQIRLIWTAVPSASGYNVQWDTDAKFSNPESTKVVGGEKTFFYLQSLTVGTTYYARVQAYGEGFPASAYIVGSKEAQIGTTVNLGDITFSGPSDNTSIVGMREFLLTATLKTQLSNPATVSFIVSASSSFPAWSDVENNPALITRTFTNAKKIRKIYFSITDRYQRKALTEVTKVNLSGTSTREEQEKSKNEAPGIMLPGNSYYVYAYNNGEHVATSAKITTLDYPSNPLPVQHNGTDQGKPTKYSAYALNMDVWQPIVTHQNLMAKEKLEIGKLDIAYIPFRYLAIFDQNSAETIALCPGGIDKKIIVQNRKMNPSSGLDSAFVSMFSFQLGQISGVEDEPKASPILFVASPQLPVTPPGNRNQVLDAMVKVKIGDLAYMMLSICFSNLGPSAMSGLPIYYLEYVDD